MLNGNLSNKSAPIIAFNVDTLLFTEEIATPLTLGNKVASLFTLDIFNERREYLNRKLDHNVLKVIRDIWTNYDFTVYLVTFKPFPEDIEQLLYGKEAFHYYTRVVSYKDLEELRPKIGNEFFLFVDGSHENIAYLGQCAVHISEVGKYFPYNKRYANINL